MIRTAGGLLKASSSSSVASLQSGQHVMRNVRPLSVILPGSLRPRASTLDGNKMMLSSLVSSKTGLRSSKINSNVEAGSAVKIKADGKAIQGATAPTTSRLLKAASIKISSASKVQVAKDPFATKTRRVAPPRIDLPSGGKDYDVMLHYVSKTEPSQFSQAAIASGWFAFQKKLILDPSSLVSESSEDVDRPQHGRRELTEPLRKTLDKLIMMTSERKFNRNQTLKIFHAVSTAKLNLLDPRVDPILTKLYDAAMRRHKNNIVDFFYKDVTPHQFANGVMALARLSKFSTALPSQLIVRTLVAEAKKRKFADFNPRDLATLTWSIATLAGPSDPADVEIVKAAADEIVRIGLTDVASQSLSAMTWSLATMDVRHDGYLEALARYMLQVDLSTFNEQDLSNTLWSYARFGFWNYNLTEVFANELERRGMAKFSYQGLTVLWTSLVKLNFPADKPDSITKIYAMTAAEIRRRGLRWCMPQSLVNLVWAFGTAGLEDEPMFDMFASEVLRRGVATMSSQNFSNLVIGFARVGYRHDALFDEIGRVFKRENLDEHNIQCISNVLWSFARLEKSDTAMLRRLVEEIKHRGLRDFIPQALANLLWSLAKLGRYYDAGLVQRVVDEVVDRGMENMDSQYISNLMWSFATFNVRDPKVMNMAAEAAKTNLKNASFQSVVNLAWSFACLDQLRLPAVREFFDMTLPVSTPVEYIGEVALQLHQCKLAWMYTHPDSQELPSLLKGLIGDGRWINAVVRSRNEENAPSTSHKEISRALREMGYSELQDEYITPNGLSGDIMIKTKNGQQILIEVDGPFHFLSNDITPTGATLFKRRLLKGEGYRVASLNVKMAWRWLKTPEEEKTYLAQLIEDTSRGNPADF